MILITTNDNVQQKLDLIDDYDVVFFEDGEYNVCELKIPNKKYIKIITDGAVLKANADCDYLMATYNYYDPTNIYTGHPLTIKGFILDANGYEVGKGIVLKNWSCEISNNQLIGFETGIEFSTETITGTQLASGTMVNNKIQENKIDCRNGIKVHDTSSTQAQITDMFITNNFISSFSDYTGSGIGINMESTAGSLIQGNHLYKFKGWDLYVKAAQAGLRIVDNIFEGHNDRAVRVYKLYTETVLFSRNIVNSRVQILNDGSSSDYKSVFHSSDNAYRKFNAESVTGHILCESNAVTVISANDSFEIETPFRTTISTTQAKVYADNTYYYDSGTVFLNGAQAFPANYPTAYAEYVF